MMMQAADKDLNDKQKSANDKNKAAKLMSKELKSNKSNDKKEGEVAIDPAKLALEEVCC
jgi:hypothetical protein